MLTNWRKWMLVGALLMGLAMTSAAAQTKLLRFPDLHGERVVFCYGGDLWWAPAAGGTAIRLTAHPGQELFPKFSPDGQWIAFTGQYDGDEQVYVIPSQGGQPKQLTFYPARGPLPPRWGYDNQVYGWTSDGQSVFFRSLRYGYSLDGNRLFTVSTEGGMPEPLPMPKSGAGDLSPDGKKAVYSPLFRDFRTWKRYQGGWAQDLQIFDLDSNSVEPVTRHPRTDRDPMWIGDTIYFASDRSGILNIYAYDTGKKSLRQVTRSREWDVRWPSKAEDQRIVYELAGELQILDARRGKSRKVPIQVPDDGLSRRPSRISAARNIEDFDLSPKGQRALFAARGDIFTAPIEHGPTRNLTGSSGAHDKSPLWSPDGRSIVFISDRDGEEQLYRIAQDGKGDLEKLTADHRAMLLNPVWSPDGKRIAYSDKDGKIYILELESKGVEQIADDGGGQVSDYSWSPQGGHLSFSLSDATGFRSIYIWSVDDSQLHRITSEIFNEFSPSWSPDGNYLYYLSDRQFAPQIGSFEWNYVVDRESGIFALALRSDVAHPFPPRSDEVTIEEEKDEDQEEGKEEEAAEAESSQEEEKGQIEIEFEGLDQRVARVPVDDDNYFALLALEGHLLYLGGGPFYYGRSSDVPSSLRLFSLEDREETVLAERINGLAVSADGKKILYRSNSGFQLIDASPAGKNSSKTVSTAGLEVDRVPAEEWEQIFDEVWRRFRDFFYVENMHGYDWEGLREQYRTLLQHVAHRSDLNYVLGEMVAELSVGHSYISGGDYQIPPRPQSGLAGARFELDRQAGRYRITRIFEGHNQEPIYRSPLTEIGVDVEQGDYLLAIDGEELRADGNPYRMLLHKADRPVSWTVNSTPQMEGARQVTYHPVSSESNLAYLDWVNSNRRKVEEMSQGRVGYIHLPDMGTAGIREFIKWFYGQTRKQGMVVDVRGNGGGNVSQMLIRRLSQQLLQVGFARTSDYAGPYPGSVFHGHLVCLLNETSASDGDIFPAMFRQAGLGPLIGKRSWGGVIGITNRGTLIDGGTVNVPEFGNATAEGEWSIEGFGVEPDIVVENDPAAVIAGRDQQLERGIQEVLKKIEKDPRLYPPQPPAPVKTPKK